MSSKPGDATLNPSARPSPGNCRDHFCVSTGKIKTGQNPMAVKGGGGVVRAGSQGGSQDGRRTPSSTQIKEAPKMKVTDVRIEVIRHEVPALNVPIGQHSTGGEVERGVLRVFTDAGIEGNCFIGAWIPAQPHFGPILDVIKPELVGGDSSEREWLWRRMQFLRDPLQIE